MAHMQPELGLQTEPVPAWLHPEGSALMLGPGTEVGAGVLERDDVLLIFGGGALEEAALLVLCDRKRKTHNQLINKHRDSERIEID